MRSVKYKCPECDEDIDRRSYRRHLINVHKYSEEQYHELKNEMMRAQEPSIICPLCDDKVPTQFDLVHHCSELHSEDGADGRPQNYTVCMREFPNEQDYKDKKKTGTVVRLIRAGKIPNSAKQRVRTSKKDTPYCTCFLNVQYRNDGTILARGCFAHVGHELDPALLRLSIEEQEYLKMLLEEHTFNYIIQRVRRENRDKNSRLFFVSRDDLWNLIKKYKIRPGCKDAVDMTSVMVRVEESNPDDGIRMFRPPDDPSGKGFLMVIVTPLQLKWLQAYSSRGVSLDDTHHTTRYNVKLATLMRFLLSGTMTTEDVSKLFEVIRQLMPRFHPRTMVTDEAQCFWNGFRKVFPGTLTQLHYCRTHIAKTWERKTRELVQADLRPTVDKALGDLLKEKQLNVFEQRFGEILAYLRAQEQVEMADYLTKNYLGKTKSWASFANRGAVMDTTMISERWHRTIKDDILHRNANCRLDCLVELLIRAVEEKSDSNDRRRLVKSSHRASESIKRHRKAAAYYADHADKIHFTGDRTWLVESSKPQEYFTVSWEGRCSCNLMSNVHCLLCDVCPYAWECTCLDNRSGVSCIHRHAVKIYGCELLPTGTNIEVEESAQEGELLGILEEEFEEGNVGVEVEGDQQGEKSVQNRREQRYQKLNEIMSTYAAVEMSAKSLAKVDSDESMKKLEKILEHLKLAADVVRMPGPGDLAPRPELAKEGAKPHLQHIELLPRGKLKKPKTKAVKDLHEELLMMRYPAPDDEAGPSWA
ncbi:zinc finger, C2H2 type [Ostertagia ostertagi]